ncbi:hypothetical protein [Chitinophaga sp. S165]|uniref:hypothetical protein n=1 Tax=Chitinophaga sp. S165 TaxID=2135462 RepID=UPI000D717811|nr:hypothetical protein [Chitinophaga sp. S165]PWV55553.1 hypothetical protein C7475_10159 [Chitinophaga sp. S165]
MKKIKLIISACAFIAGAGTAIVLDVQAAAAPQIFYDWIDWNGNTILYGVTQQQAQSLCAPSIDVCLRAKGNVLIHTTGILPW